MINLGWGLVWTIVNLIVLYLLLKKFLVSPVLGIMEKRKNLIASQLEEARMTQQKAEELKGHYEGALASAKEESAQILEEAKADARQVSQRIVKDANEQASRILEQPRKRQNRKREMLCRAQRQKSQGLPWRLPESCWQTEAARKATRCFMMNF